MIKNLKEGSEAFKDYDSELLLKILNKTSLENKKGCLLYTSDVPTIQPV